MTALCARCNNNIAALLSKARLHVKYESLNRLWLRVRMRVFQVSRFLVYEIEGKCEEWQKEWEDGLIVREIDTDELREHRSKGEDFPSEFFEDRGGGEGRSIAAFMDGEIAFITWVSTTKSSGFVELRKDEVEINDSYCRKKYRGNRLYRKVLVWTVNKMADEGLRRVWIVIHDKNIPAVKSVESAGFRGVEEVKRWLVFTWGRRRIV